MAARIRKPTKREKEGFCVYLGPSIRGIVNYGRIFQGSIQDAKEEIWDGVQKYPLIASLLIPSEELSKARIQVKTPGNALYALYNQLIRELAK